MYTLEGTGVGKEAVSSKQGGANVSGIIICKPRHYIPRNTCVSRGVFAFPSNRYRGKPGDGAASAEANKPRVVIIDSLPKLSASLLHPLSSILAARFLAQSGVTIRPRLPPRVASLFGEGARFLNLTRRNRALLSREDTTGDSVKGSAAPQ